MDKSIVQRGLTSLRWFLAAHADELSGDLLWTLGDSQDVIDQSDDLLRSRLHDLSSFQIQQLCSAIEGVHRSYFGTMNGRELSSFLHHFAEEDSNIPHG